MDFNSIGDVKKIARRSVAGVFLAVAGFSSFYTVDQTDMANVRRMGHVVSTEPVGSGLHFKLPFVDKVDHLQVSQRTLHIPAFSVNTIDNQQITLDLNFNYTVPKNQVNHLLYEIGKAGQGDIDSSIIPIVMDRAGRVFNQQNTTTLSANREEIQAKVTAAVFEVVKEQFGIMPHTLQFAKVGYSPAFVSSNEKAVTAKNDAIAEQNKKVVEQAKADQKVITAKGDADAAVIAATGEKTSQELAGQGQGSRLRAEIAALGSPENYIKYLAAKAQNNWDGKAPQVMSGSGGGATVVVPMPSAKSPTP